MAATHVYWSKLPHGSTQSFNLYHRVENPNGVILHFDTPGITPYDIELIGDVFEVQITDLITGRRVTFEINGLNVSPGNVKFAGGGVLLVGDGTYDDTFDNDGNTLTGGKGDDQLVGLLGDDLLIGGSGFDVFTDQFGSNSIDGGAGNDFFYVFQDLGSSSTVTGGAGQDFYYLDYESPALAADPVDGPGHDYLVTDFEAGAGGDIIYTSDLIYLAVAYIEDDPFAEGFLRFIDDPDSPGTLLYQGDRDGAAGSVHDWITLISLEGVTEGEIHPDNLPDLVIGGDGDDVLNGSARADLMTSQLGNDSLEGKGGKDYLSGGEGSDVLDGGAGADTMLGGLQDDVYWVNHKDDEVIEASEPGLLVLPGDGEAAAGGSIGDRVKAAINYVLDDFVENLELIGAAARGTGNSLANNLKGNAGSDTLNGAGGDDSLDGGSDSGASDLLQGGAGDDRLTWRSNDRLDGGSGVDTLRASGNLDLTQIANSAIKSIEWIDLSTSGGQKLTLSGSDVLALSGDTDTIRVVGTSADSVDIVGSFTPGDVSGDYRTYSIGSAILQIDTEIAVS